MPVEYFDIVFTLPAPIGSIAYQNKAVVYAILFEAAAETLRTIAADKKHLGAQIGMTMVLHTWGQTLTHHPHVHCIVPGGGLSPDGTRWISCKPGYFLPERVLSRLFRRLFSTKLIAAHQADKLRFSGELAGLAGANAFAMLLAPLRRVEWVVHAKRPFAGPGQVLAYLSRYTHRVAISNRRLVAFDNGRVSFTWKDYAHCAAPKRMTLETHEFIRRFLLHVLPDGFQRIRHYGFLANGHRRAKVALIRQLLDATAQLIAKAAKVEPAQDGTAEPKAPLCPCCGGAMVIVESCQARAGAIEGSIAHDRMPSGCHEPAAVGLAPRPASHVHNPAAHRSFAVFAIQRHAKLLATDLSQTRWIRHQPLAEPQKRRRNRSIPITATARCPRFSSIRFL